MAFGNLAICNNTEKSVNSSCKIFGIFERGQVVRCRWSSGELQAVLSIRWQGNCCISGPASGGHKWQQ